MFSRWFYSTFSALTERDYRVLFIGTQVAFLAFQMSNTAQSVVAFNIAGSNSAVGAVWLGQGISMIFLAPIGGVVADRVSKRFLLFVGQGLIGLTFVATGALIVLDLMTILLLAVSAAMLGIGFAIMGPARQAYVAELVPKEKVANAVALSQLAVTGAQVAGPILASVLISLAFLGGGGTFLIMGGMFIFVLASLAQLPPAVPAAGARRLSLPSIAGDLRLGFMHIWSQPRLRIIVFSFMAVTLTAFPHQALLPGLLENELGKDAAQTGVMLGASSAAGIVVGLVVTGMVSGRLAWIAMLGMGAMLGLGLILLSLMPSYALALVTMGLVGAGFIGFRLVNNALLLTEADRAFHGRVMSIVMMGFGAQAAASLPIALLADAIGERPVLAGEGVAALAVIGVATLAYLRLGAGAVFPGEPRVAPEPKRLA